MTRVVDYSHGRPDLACLRAHGVGGVVRYFDDSNPAAPSGKALSVEEARAIERAGLALWIVYETTAGAPGVGPADRQGVRYFTPAQGQEDGHRALAFLRTVPVVGGATVYFAVDYDAQPNELAAIAAYLREAELVLVGERYHAGVYGSYRVVEWGSRLGLPTWQTYAWSGGLRHPSAALYQFKNGVTLCGAEVDLNVTQGAAPWDPSDAAMPVLTDDPAPLSRGDFAKWVNETIGPAADAPRGTLKGELNYALRTLGRIGKAGEE